MSTKPIAIPSRTTARTSDPLNVASRLDELRHLKDGWLEGRGMAPSGQGLDWLADSFARSFPDSLALPYLYPTPEGGVQAEWTVGSRETSLAINLSTHVAVWHSLDARTDFATTTSFDLDDPSDWQRLAEAIRGDQIKA